jgi:hypothetical protein
MRRAQAYKDEIGKLALVYLRESWDNTITGTLHMVTDDDIVLEVSDADGEYVGLRHTIPWDSVHRVTTADRETLNTLHEDYDEKDVPVAPSWVLEILAGEDDGAV